VAAASDRQRSGEHLLARHFHVVRLAGVLLEGGYDLVRRPAKLDSAFAPNQQFPLPPDSIHYAQDRRNWLRSALDAGQISTFTLWAC
jgi:hypothetical protein